MGAICNGMAAHGGLRPFCSTFFSFKDYMAEPVRLAAVMRLPVVFVFTHDSIGLGEDGPTHQPIEHLAALRAMPNLWVMRPADPIETAECWALALARTDGPSLLALSRQNVPTVRGDDPDHDANRCARGGYVLAEAEGARRVTLLATGSEVSLALQARERLQAFGVGSAVVSMPCFELFDAQDGAYRAEVLGSGVRIAVEAASPFGWARYVGDENNVVGMRSFGASAPAGKLYEHFGITADRVVELARRRLSG